MRCKLAVARFLSKADFCTSTLITQAIPLAATAIKCNAFDWLYLLWTNMHGEHAASVVHVILAGQFMFFFLLFFPPPSYFLFIYQRVGGSWLFGKRARRVVIGAAAAGNKLGARATSAPPTHRY